MAIHERIAVWLLRLMGVGFVVFGGLFALLPEATLRTVNAWGSWVGIHTELPAGEGGLWRALAVAYMAMVAVLAFWGSVRTAAQRALLSVLVVGKATSALMALALYLWERPAFVYLLGSLVDATIALLVALCIAWLTPKHTL